jgi:AmmeMemoRadiSam system protein B/AmmeMemoRadiSam system protein A
MEPSNHEQVNREPAVAGKFYPRNPAELKKELNRLFAAVPYGNLPSNVIAIISPHAGYLYSGGVAASGFMQVDPDKDYDNVFVIGSSHRVAYEGAAIYTMGNYMTPLGIVEVNRELARELVEKNPCFKDLPDAHIDEHCLEVQLPFLQNRLKRPFRIVPIVIGTQRASTCQKVAMALNPYFTTSNLFVISTDFSHYPGYDDATAIDKKTAAIILSNEPEKFIDYIVRNDDTGISNLQTKLCGWTSVLTLMYLTESKPGIQYTLVDYKNSGDAIYYGDKSRVVGYCAISVTADEKPAHETGMFTLSHTDRKKLLEIARGAITNYLLTGHIPEIDHNELSPALLNHSGAFVTLHKQGKLRGCTGRFNPDTPLWKIIQEISVSSAVRDHRFSRLGLEEIPEITIEISILSPLTRIRSSSEIIPGKHGIYIIKDSNSGTYLPQVASRTGWTPEEFLGYCARDKAGIGWYGWKNAELYTYEAVVFSE